MLKIHLNTGTAFTKTIEVEGSLQDDIVEILDEYYEENGLPVPTFTMDELLDIYDEEEVDMELETMIPINGGEFWIEGISHIEEI